MILWDHGGGSAGGLVIDEQFQKDRLSLGELHSAFDRVFTADSDDEDSLWPASVTVQLKANDEESETYSLNSENSWTYKWEELPAYDDDGNLIKYTIDEA